jgi:hypothetical protein
MVTAEESGEVRTVERSSRRERERRREREWVVREREGGNERL